MPSPQELLIVNNLDAIRPAVDGLFIPDEETGLTLPGFEIGEAAGPTREVLAALTDAVRPHLPDFEFNDSLQNIPGLARANDDFADEVAAAVEAYGADRLKGAKDIGTHLDQPYEGLVLHENDGRHGLGHYSFQKSRFHTDPLAVPPHTDRPAQELFALNHAEGPKHRGKLGSGVTRTVFSEGIRRPHMRVARSFHDYTTEAAGKRHIRRFGFRPSSY